jgi:glycosyltransferase involved in cell wall biosynthesis
MVNQYAITPSQAGGTRHYDLARELISRGHAVKIIASSFHHTSRAESGVHRNDEIWKTENVNGVEFLWLRTPSYNGNGLRRILNFLHFALGVGWRRAMYRYSRPDIVIGSSPSPFAALAAERLARRYRVPFVLEIRDLWPQSLVDVGKVRPSHPFVRVLSQLEKYLYRHADHIVTLLPNARENMVKRGANPEAISWVPNGVKLPPQVSAARPGTDRTFVALYAGAHGTANALGTVLDAASLLKKGSSNIRIVLVGNGPEKKRLQARTLSEKLSNVEFCDYVPKSDVFNLMAQADAFIFTLVRADVFSQGVSANKLFGYMAAARPVVFACQSSNNPIDEAECGLTVAPEDPAALAEALIQLSAFSPAEREAMGQRGRAYVERHHNIELLAGRLEQLLIGLVGSGAHAQTVRVLDALSFSAAPSERATRASPHSTAE